MVQNLSSIMNSVRLGLVSGGGKRLMKRITPLILEYLFIRPALHQLRKHRK